MLPEVSAPYGPARVEASPWVAALVRLSLAWAILFAVTFAEWREMAHQWWDIDTYNHVLLVPPILGWLVWLRHDELARITPAGWWPGLGWAGAGLAALIAGRAGEINLVSEGGALMMLQGAMLAFVGLRAGLVLTFPLFYSFFLVPFGDELIPTLQQLTARMTVSLIDWSGVPAVVEGLTIDTPGGKFVVAEECSGVKFLIAMVALAVLVGWTAFARWKRRIVLVAGAALISILANGVRAWGTIYIAQYIGAERAGGFDHIVYGWVFFALVVAAVLGVAWRFFEREPVDAGLTAAEAGCHPLIRFEGAGMSANAGLALVIVVAMIFAALAPLS